MSDIHKIEVSNIEVARQLLLNQNDIANIFKKRLNVQFDTRGNQIILKGESKNTELAEKIIKEFCDIMNTGHIITSQDIEYGIRTVMNNPDVSLADIYMDTVFVVSKHKSITPKTLGQKRYVDAIRKNDIVFGIGPAGTGKTYLAMAMAITSLFSKSVKRIILTRPAVEAGEKLGFLPGDLEEKVNPYLRPLYDALNDMIEFERFQSLVSRGIIEIAPLAFMRGRTLNDSFVILDEAQNTTLDQMKMFLTRMGFYSKVVITGDITQIDLPSNIRSGLVESIEILRGIPGIEFCFMSEQDVVRHPLVQEIIKAFDKKR
ncbi:MAG: PhoH family protein [Deltaproteobacteria bacterium]|nr:PhoH family protein [Deltaproteobacteria bacterium]